MNKTQVKNKGLLPLNAETWNVEFIDVYLDQTLLAIKKSLKLLCDKYLKDISLSKRNFNLPPHVCIERRKLLEEIRFLSNSDKSILHSSLSVVIYLFKAYEELIFHGYRCCQRYLKYLFSEQCKGQSDESIFVDSDLKKILNFIDSYIGEYQEECDSLIYFFERLEKSECPPRDTYIHPKFAYLEFLLSATFELIPQCKIVICCQSTYHMLEVCNFLLRFQPVIKPLICIDEGDSHADSFCQEAKEIVEGLFSLSAVNIIVRSCCSLKDCHLTEADQVFHIDVEQHSLKQTNYSDSEELKICNIEVYSGKKIQEAIKEKIMLSNSVKCKSPSPASHQNSVEPDFAPFEFDEKVLQQLDKVVNEYMLNKNIAVPNHVFEETTNSNKEKICEAEMTKAEDYRKRIQKETEDFLKTSKKISFDLNEESMSLQDFSFGASFCGATNVSNTAKILSSTPLNKEIKTSKVKVEINPNTETQHHNICNTSFDLFDEWDTNEMFEKKNQNSKIFSENTNVVDKAEKNRETNYDTNAYENSNISKNSTDLFAPEVFKTSHQSIQNPVHDALESHDINFIEKKKLNKCNRKKDIPGDSQKNVSLTTKSMILKYEDDNAQTNITKVAKELCFDKTKTDSFGNERNMNKRNSKIQSTKPKVFKVEETDDEESDILKENECEVEVLKRKNMKTISGSVRKFLETQVEVTDENSSDEYCSDELYDESFVDDKSYSSANESNNMTSIYLESIKENKNEPGTFKIPQLKPYIIGDIFSQDPQGNNSDYEINSFCVNTNESENSELSELEIAEQLLEIKRKKKKRLLKKKNKAKKSM